MVLAAAAAADDFSSGEIRFDERYFFRRPRTRHPRSAIVACCPTYSPRTPTPPFRSYQLMCYFPSPPAAAPFVFILVACTIVRTKYNNNQIIIIIYFLRDYFYGKYELFFIELYNCVSHVTYSCAQTARCIK